MNHAINSFFPDVKKMMRSSCHDGAVTVDSLSDVPEVQTLLLTCRNIVTTLHFKSYVIKEELVSTADRAEVDKLFARISAVSEVAELDNFSVVEYDEQGSQLSPQGENREVERCHSTLKLSYPTRWNSTLAMVESIDLQGEVHNSFKRLGHAEPCLHAEETDMLKELVMFLKEFEGFTDLISTSGCTTRTSYWTFVVQPTRVV